MHLPTLVNRRRRCPVAAVTPYRQRPNCKLFCAGIQNCGQKVQEVCTIEQVCLHLVPTAERFCVLAAFWQLLWFQGPTLLATRWQAESGLHHRIWYSPKCQGVPVWCGSCGLNARISRSTCILEDSSMMQSSSVPWFAKSVFLCKTNFRVTVTAL